MSDHVCPVCDFTGLFDAPWVDGSPSDEICPSCGIHFGYDDFDEVSRAAVHRGWRGCWSAFGNPWFSRSRLRPGSE